MIEKRYFKINKHLPEILVEIGMQEYNLVEGKQLYVLDRLSTKEICELIQSLKASIYKKLDTIPEMKDVVIHSLFCGIEKITTFKIIPNDDYYFYVVIKDKVDYTKFLKGV